MTTTATQPATPNTKRRSALIRKPNLPAGVGGVVWLVIVIVPIYYVVITSLKGQAGYFSSNPMLPSSPTLENYRLVFDSGFLRYFTNSVIVTVGTVVPTVAVAFMAAYALVRGSSRPLSAINTIFLLGLAVPLQATIVPIYWLITRLHLYDTLLAIILPSIAFAIPVSVLILSNFLRDIPKELFESMRMDGATDWTMLWRLAMPLVKPALVTIAIYNALNVWNSFMIPLILTQSASSRTLPLSLWTFQGEFTINTPAVLAAVVLSLVPLLALYAFGRRQLVSGLTAGFSK